MRRATTFLCSMALLIGIGPAVACDKPGGQSFRHFYNTDTFGQLGVKGLGQNVHILDQYKCYDFSFLIDKNLRIYFNHASEGTSGPTYVGAIILRVFSSETGENAPFSAYLYRNSTEKGSSSRWAQMKSAAEKPRIGNSYPDADVSFVDEYFDENARLPAKDLAELNELSRKPESPVSTQVKGWHALVLGKGDSGYRLYENTTATGDKWFGLDVDALGSARYSIIRSYLTKYQASPNPRPQEFFSSGAQSADCVYIKLIAPGDTASSFAIEHPKNSRDFITLKMRKTADCQKP